ncbi:amidohydrolase family protein [Sphingobium sp.]|uniref:amidohydrolase family protein n=1 Tax=Sphingobium sp. TaxID=1912891 RepID=UPI0028BE879D|nr:amidohydrolase family protein [Sphingobium sp.]
MKIDIHHHFIPRAYMDRAEALVPPGVVVAREGAIATFADSKTGFVYLRVDPQYWCDPMTQLANMDAAGVDHAILSPACYQDWMTLEAAQIINDGTAEVVARYPDRFSGMISVPPDGDKAMVAEIRRARGLGLCALNITTIHQGRFPDHPDFRLLLEVAAELDLPVFVHPSWRCSNCENLGQWNLERSVGIPGDLNLCVARVLFSGILDDLPGLRFIFPHLGGSLPMTFRRLFLNQGGPLVNVPDRDYPELLKRVYFDTAPGIWQSPLEIEFGVRSFGSSQVMLGSDYPLSHDPDNLLCRSVQHVADATLPDSDKQRIFSANAIELFRLART